MSAPLANYVALHRHAAVRLEVLNNPRLALRMVVASLLCGENRMGGVGCLYSSADPQKALNDGITASLAQSHSIAAFRTCRREIIQHMGCKLPDDEPNNITAIHDSDAATGYFEASHRESLFSHLVTLEDHVVQQVLALLVAECMSVHDPLIDILGTANSINLGLNWTADDVFFDLLRDKTTINAMLAEVAGDDVAKGNTRETGKVQKDILRDCLEACKGRSAPIGWVPRWMWFPKGSYITQ
jgi:ParB family transcriptional regulator, chromosome partitioning protein